MSASRRVGQSCGLPGAENGCHCVGRLRLPDSGVTNQAVSNNVQANSGKPRHWNAFLGNPKHVGAKVGRLAHGVSGCHRRLERLRAPQNATECGSLDPSLTPISWPRASLLSLGVRAAHSTLTLRNRIESCMWAGRRSGGPGAGPSGTAGTAVYDSSGAMHMPLIAYLANSREVVGRKLRAGSRTASAQSGAEPSPQAHSRGPRRTNGPTDRMAIQQVGLELWGIPRARGWHVPRQWGNRGRCGEWASVAGMASCSRRGRLTIPQHLHNQLSCGVGFRVLVCKVTCEVGVAPTIIPKSGQPSANEALSASVSLRYAPTCRSNRSFLNVSLPFARGA